MKNRWEDDRDLIAALELEEVPAVVDEKLQALYRELPETVPTGEQRGMSKKVKRLITAASAVAAALVILVSAAAVNPALAEGIPFIGHLFSHMENRSGWKNSERTLLSLEKYAQPLEGVTVTAPATNVLEEPMTFSAEEVYYDGTFLFVGVSAEIHSDRKELYFHRFFSSGVYNLLINGEELAHYEEGKGLVYEDGSFEVDNCYLQKTENGNYIAKRGQVLPERFRNREKLSVTLRFVGVYYRRDLTGTDRTVNSSPVELNFTVEKNDAPVLHFDGGDMGMGGVKLNAGVATPAGIFLTIDRLESYNNPACGISFEGGGVIGPVGYADFEPSLGNGYVRKTLISGGYAEDEERRLLVSVFDKNDTDEYVAVFLIDPRTGEIELGSEDDIVYYPGSIYYCPPEEMLNSEERHKIEFASHKDGGNQLLLSIATKDAIPQTGTKVEVWQDEALLGSREFENEANYHFYDNDRVYTGENDDITRYEAERHTYLFSLLGMEVLDPDRPVTVKFYGRDGELQMEESFQLP